MDRLTKFHWMVAKGYFYGLATKWELIQWYYKKYHQMNVNPYTALQQVHKDHFRMLLKKCGDNQDWLTDLVWDTKVNIERHHHLNSKYENEYISHIEALLNLINASSVEIDYEDMDLFNTVVLSYIKGEIGTSSEISKPAMRVISRWVDKTSGVVYDDKFGYH